MDNNQIQKLLAQASKVEVITTTIRTWGQPHQNDNTYTGDSKFTKAFAEVIGKSDNEVVHIYVTELIGEWNYRHDISHTDFVKCFAFEVLNKSLPKFVTVLFQHSNGWQKDATDRIKTAEAEVLNAHEDGERYWKNLVAQESAIAKAKADADRIAKEILDAKSKDGIDQFGAGEPQV